MRHVNVMLIGASFLSACASPGAKNLQADHWSAAPPSKSLINHIEDMLADDPCVGDIRKWARLYEWRQTKDGIDTSVIDIDLRQAGVFGFQSGRVVRARDPSLRPGEIMIAADDRDYRVAFGSYEVATDALNLDFCGRNRN
jgi:hypothetical protein